jgi:hypothetical protein
MARHPRLLFGPGDVPALRRFARGEGKRFFRQLVDYRRACKPPEKPDFLRDATNGQRIGLWRMPTVALHYLLTGDAESFRRTKGYMTLLLDLPHWETGSERDSGMSSANVMIGAALAYDWLHDDLDAEFRERFRRKLLYMARAQYHGGHLNKNRATGYWQNDPANNHRWHRDAGMVLAVLTAYEGGARERWILARCLEEMRYVARWLPEDGTSHEGPSYLIFGGAHLTLACQASDRCFGTEFLRGEFFKNAPLFRLHTAWPGFEEAMQYGDSAGMGNYSNFLWKCAAVHRLADVQAGLDVLAEKNPKAWWLGWMSLVWYDPSLGGGSPAHLPTRAMFADLGLATMRDRWSEGGVAAMFKCGPFGGHRLNAFRKAHGMRYINVAHDDPDAGSFTIHAGGEVLAETDRYSKSKRSSNHNTILINGVGQTVKGRPEGAVWTQPGRGDMSRMALLTAWKDAGDVAIVEGEASGAYPAMEGKRPALERFRRTFVWVQGRYILVLDDIRAPEPVEISWLIQGAKLTAAGRRDDRGGPRDPQAGASQSGRYVLAKGDASCRFQVVSDAPTVATIGEGTADHRGKRLRWRQLRLTARGEGIRLASVFDPWDVGVSVQLADRDDGSGTVVVRAGDGIDRWTWRRPRGRFEPSGLVGRRAGKTLADLGDDG